MSRFDDDTKPETPVSKVTPTPAGFLRNLEHYPSGYAELVETHGSLPRAAHELARIRILARGVAEAPPTPHEISGAAWEIVTRGGLTRLVPPREALVADCLAEGLEVAGYDAPGDD